jgi:endonuclease/exonuclease/phosphatase family metal-dependent hydrolase
MGDSLRTCLRNILAAATALLLAPAIAPQPAQAASTVRLTAMQWNVGGGWKYQTPGASDLLVAKIFDTIKGKNPDFVALNEICQSQYAALTRRLQNETDWPQDKGNFVRFQATRNGTTDDGDVCDHKAVGIALLSRQPLGTANRFPLTPNPEFDKDEIRHLLCAPTTTMPVRYCVTHITPKPFGTFGKIQVNEVLRHVEGFEAAGDTVLVGGDFNATPSWPELNVWYDPSVNTPANGDNVGAYREMDDADPYCLGYGEGTTRATTGSPCGTGTKIDMIFFRANHLNGQHAGDSLPLSTCGSTLCSDHRIYWGWADLSIG